MRKIIYHINLNVKSYQCLFNLISNSYNADFYSPQKGKSSWLWPCQATSVTPNKTDLQVSVIQNCNNPKPQMEVCFCSDLDRILTNGTANHNFPSTYYIYHTAQ